MALVDSGDPGRSGDWHGVERVLRLRQAGRLRTTLRALWGLAHTTDPSRAKYWVDPYGTSNMCMKRDCYKDTYGTVYRCLLDNTVHDAKDLPTSLEVVS